MRTLTWREVWSRRLAVHRLARPAPASGLVEVAGAMAGVHAQVMASAELAVGLRVAGFTRTDLRRALREDRTLVKTYGPRGTVHLFPSDELPVWLAALRANRSARSAAPAVRYDARTRAVIEAIRAALDGRCLTREELGEEVGRRAGAWAVEKTFPAFGDVWPLWWSMIGPAAVDGALCFGPNRGARVTFVRPEQWLAGRGGWEEVGGEAALRDVLRRYLAAYGPARPRDFAQWFQMDEAAAADLTRSLGAELEEVDVEGWRAWQLVAGSGPADGEEPASSVRLLPQFDAYVVGCHPRQHLVPVEVRARLDEGRVPAVWARRAIAAGAWSTIPTLLVDGVVAGVWQRRREGRRVELRVEAFRELSDGEEHALEAEARRVGEVIETAASLTLGAVEVQPHL